ncbi:MAG TPA: DUF1304 family protein [Nocardioides sp.]|uniref:DUF1304 family protein n=1 Tax=Nocardioides sp. TaxID=35761 RepID=UPI002D80E756|nr:DUF1304 family protein [Nocardioides sp.]HET6652039.1 DUF1304 family protein [Nocardioides sp.]
MSALVQVIAALIATCLVVVGLLEIFAYRNPRLYPIFVIEPDDQDAVRMWAICVGFYNLVFAAGIFLGLALLHWGDPAAGRALVLFLTGAHVLLGIVLVAVQPRLWRSAIGEALPPAVLLGLTFA